MLSVYLAIKYYFMTLWQFFQPPIATRPAIIQSMTARLA